MADTVSSPGKKAMGVGITLNSPDPAKAGARCRALGIDRVSLRCETLPGFNAEAYTGTPDRATLKTLVEQIAEQGIGISCLCKVNAFGLDQDIVRNPRAHRGEIDAMLATIEAAGQAGIDTILHYVNPREPEDPKEDEAVWGNLTGIFKELVAQAQVSGVKLANHGVWACLPDGLREEALAEGVQYSGYRHFRREGWIGPYLVRTAEHIARIVEDEVPSPNNGVCLCSGMYINGAAVPAWAKRFQGKIFYAQPRDLIGRWPAAREVFPGEGEVDLPQILQILHEGGYTGTVQPEHLGHPRFPDEDLEAAAVARVKGWVEAINAANP